MPKFLIRSKTERDDETGKPLYWSNVDGWVDRDSATRFEEKETWYGTLPTVGGQEQEWEPAD